MQILLLIIVKSSRINTLLYLDSHREKLLFRKMQNEIVIFIVNINSFVSCQILEHIDFSQDMIQ